MMISSSRDWSVDDDVLMWANFPSQPHSRRHRVGLKLPREPVRGLGRPGDRGGGAGVAGARQQRRELGADGAAGVVGRQMEPTARERGPQQLLRGRGCWRGHRSSKERGLVLVCRRASWCARRGRRGRLEEEKRKRRERKEKEKAMNQDEVPFASCRFFFPSASTSSLCLSLLLSL